MSKDSNEKVVSTIVHEKAGITQLRVSPDCPERPYFCRWTLFGWMRGWGDRDCEVAEKGARPGWLSFKNWRPSGAKTSIRIAVLAARLDSPGAARAWRRDVF